MRNRKYLKNLICTVCAAVLFFSGMAGIAEFSYNKDSALLKAPLSKVYAEGAEDVSGGNGGAGENSPGQDSGPDVNPGTDAKPEPEPDLKPDPKPVPKPVPKPDPGDVAKPEEKPGKPSTGDIMPSTNLVVKVMQNGSEKSSKTYTYRQIADMASTRETYTSMDDEGTPVQISAQGIKVEELMKKSGVDPVKLKNITITSSQEGSRKFTQNFMFGVKRYAYPDLPDAYRNGNPAAAAGNKREVMPVLAVRSCEKIMGKGDNYKDMDYAYGMRFCYGQFDPKDSCCTLYSSHINSIVFDIMPEDDAEGFGGVPEVSGGIDDVGPENITATVDGKTVKVPSTITVRIGYLGYENYIERKTFSFQELASLPKVKQIYTMLDSRGNLVMDTAIGVRLVDIVAASGVDLSSVQSFTFHSKDPSAGGDVNMQRKALIDTPRYYYPAMPQKWNSVSKKPGPGSMLGAVRVHTILTFKDCYDVGSAVPNYFEVEPVNRFRLVMGQADSGDVTASDAVRWIDGIDLMITGKPPAEGSGNLVSSDLAIQTDTMSGSGSSADQSEMGDKFSIKTNAAVKSGNTKLSPKKTVYEVSQAVPMDAENNNMNVLLTVISVLLFIAGLAGHIRIYKKEEINIKNLK